MPLLTQFNNFTSWIPYLNLRIKTERATELPLFFNFDLYPHIKKAFPHSASLFTPKSQSIYIASFFCLSANIPVVHLLRRSVQLRNPCIATTLGREK
jgi:hypothetical protein